MEHCRSSANSKRKDRKRIAKNYGLSYPNWADFGIGEPNEWGEYESYDNEAYHKAVTAYHKELEKRKKEAEEKRQQTFGYIAGQWFKAKKQKACPVLTYENQD